MNGRPEQLELSLIRGYQHKIEAKYTEDSGDIPAGLILAEVGSPPLYKSPVAVIRNGVLKAEEWLFRKPSGVEEFTGGLSKHAKEGVQALAEKLDIGAEVVFQAALLTRTLIEQSGDQTAVDFDGGPEVMRLVRSTLPESQVNGVLIPKKEGYMLEYYSCYQVIAFPGEIIPVRSLVIHTNHSGATFQEIFPVALMLSAVVTEKNKPEQIVSEEVTGIIDSN